MAKTKKSETTEFVLRRLNWQRSKPWLARLPGEVRIKAFDDPDEAEAERKRREDEARRQVNPFLCGGGALHYQTHFDAPRLHDWLLDHGLEPPGPDDEGTIDWAGWWTDNSPNMNEEQWARVWKALDKVRFYEVVEQPVCPIVFVVVRMNWFYTDEYFIAEPEGGEPDKAYRDRERAELECESCNDIAWDIWQESLEEYHSNMDDPQRQFDISSRCAQKAGPFQKAEWEWTSERYEDLKSTTEVNFYEVVEVELEE